MWNSGLEISPNSYVFSQNKVYHLAAYMKSDLIIPLNPTICILCIETIEGHMKFHLKNAIKHNNIKWHVQPRSEPIVS